MQAVCQHLPSNSSQQSGILVQQHECIRSKPVSACHAGHVDTAPSAKSNLTGRMAGNFQKVMGIGSNESETAKVTQPESAGSHAANNSDATFLIPVALAAFAISAYIRSTLCPALQSYFPQPVQILHKVGTA